MEKKIFIPLFTLLLSACQPSFRGPIRLDFEYHDDYTVCVLNDTHYNFLTDMDRETEYLKKVIYSRAKLMDQSLDIASSPISELDEYAPDLIILNGDTFMNANKYVVNRLFSFLDTLNIPFGLTYGNHDREGYYGTNYVNYALGKYKNSIKLYRDNDNVMGDSNYVINLKQGDEIKWQIICMDTNTYKDLDYDGIHQEQVDWYKEEVILGGGAPSILLAHIPIEEFEDAWNIASLDASNGQEQYMICPGKDYNGKSSWWMLENVSCAPKPDNLYETIEELGTRTKAMIVAHDHINNTDFYYDPEEDGTGIRFIFGTKTGDGIYHDVRTMGCSFYTLNNDETFTTTRVNVQYNGETFEMSDVYLNSGGTVRE